MKSGPSAPPRSPGLRLARAAWLLLAATAAGVFAAGVPARFYQLTTVTPEAMTAVGQLRPADAEALARAGLSLNFYAWYFTGLETLVAVVLAAVAGLIFWRGSAEAMSLLVASVLLLIALAMPVPVALERAQPAWHLPVLWFRTGFVASIIPFVFLFPDGRCAPRWTRWGIILWVSYALAGLAFPRLWPPAAFGSGLTSADLPAMAWVLGWLAFGVLTQVYRYHRVSTPGQRQQTKWVVFGLGIFLALVSTGILVLIPPLDPSVPLSTAARLAGPTLVLIAAMTLPLSLGVSILRYRLWDIDVIIRRTLVYAALSGLLGLVYFSSIVLLQALFRGLTGQGRNQLVTVLSTLAIAALFVPLRARVQTAIDRRFYRRKYDAAKTLAAFSAAARDETDLSALTRKLTGVIQDTMEPESVGVWLRSPAAASSDAPAGQASSQ